VKCRSPEDHAFRKGEDKCLNCGWYKGDDSTERVWKTLLSTGTAHLFIGNRERPACNRPIGTTGEGVWLEDEDEAWSRCYVCRKAEKN
jgi:hypothetical protein